MEDVTLALKDGKVRPLQGDSIDALAAGVLAARGRTQVEIAQALKLSQSVVSRLLKQVQDYIYVERSFRWDKLPPAVQDEVRRRISHPEIGGRLASLAKEHGRPAPVVYVMPLGENADLEAQFPTFATHTAMVLRDLLENVRGPVGVAWGSTIWESAQKLRAILAQRPFRERAPIEFIPLCGDPVIDPQERYADRTSSRIVSELSRAVNGDGLRPPWLGLVPAFIPRSFKKEDEIRIIDKLIDLVPQYPRIFGPRITRSRSMPSPLGDDLHMIITAAGHSKSPLGFGRTPLLGLTDAESKLLAESIYGDIGGVLLPRPAKTLGRNAHQRNSSLVEEITRRWTGLKLEHLKACSSRAFSEGSTSRPGVTLLSFGSSHVEVVLEAIRQGLVNQLIIGSDLAEALAKTLQGEGGNGGEEFPEPSRVSSN